VYSKLIEIVKRDFKEFFLESKDLVQNSNGEINQKHKGNKKSLSQGAYEFGDGIFDLKFDCKIGLRTNVPTRDKRGRSPISNVNKANHFWWLISKAYLNKYLLKDAKKSLKSFINKNEAEKESETNKSGFHKLFSHECLDFETLVENDLDLEGVQESDVKDTKIYPHVEFLDDNLWANEPKLNDKEEQNLIDQGIDFYKSKYENISENDIKWLIKLCEEPFQIEPDESRIGMDFN